MSRLAFAKGHGTQNDFVVIPDRHNMTPLSPAAIACICDHHTGLGADGLIRAVKAAHMREWDGDPDLWFMDFWNPDGSPAQMCGNGLRVLARYLIEEDLAPRPVMQIATRAGLRTVWEQPGGVLRTGMGQALVTGPTWAKVAGRGFDAVGVDVGNPHVVVALPDDVSLESLDLREAPQIDDQRFTSGANVEFWQQDGQDRLNMRVFERGAGETRSCGTGVVAVAIARRSQTGLDNPQTVQVPGGRLGVDFDGQEAYLTGPAVIVAHGELVVPEGDCQTDGRRDLA